MQFHHLVDLAFRLSSCAHFYPKYSTRTLDNYAGGVLSYISFPFGTRFKITQPFVNPT